MVDDRLDSSFLNLGYQRVNSNAQGIYLYYLVMEQELVMIAVTHVLKGNELSAEQYDHILDQMKESFYKTYSCEIQLLSLILTEYPDKVKQLCTDTRVGVHWIIDVNINRLLIYETQANDFYGLKNKLEQLLEEEPVNYSQDTVLGRDYSYKADEASELYRSDNTSRTLQFTLMNTILIVANLIAYIITHYTDAFGGADQMYIRGALSWYFVKENNEYYRLLTSMFMHADGSHLVNNMLVLLFIGSGLERAVGKLKYLFLYFGTGILAGLTSFGYNMWKENGMVSVYKSTFSVGASGAIFGIIGAIFFIVVINRGSLEEISKGRMILFVVLSLYSGIINSNIDQAAHIGGFVAGILLTALIYRRAKVKKDFRNHGRFDSI